MLVMMRVNDGMAPAARDEPAIDGKRERKGERETPVDCRGSCASGLQAFHHGAQFGDLRFQIANTLAGDLLHRRSRA